MTLLQLQIRNLVEQYGYAKVRRALVETAAAQLDAEHARARNEPDTETDMSHTFR